GGDQPHRQYPPAPRRHGAEARAGRRAASRRRFLAVPQAYPSAMVVGATAWGTTLAVHLARNGQPTILLARTAEEAEALRAAGSNERRLPGVAFPALLTVTHDPQTLSSADAVGLVVFAVPSRTLVANASALTAHVPPDATLLSAVKGIETATGRRMTEVLCAVLPGRPVAVLSGPNLSREVAAGLPGSTVIATEDAEDRKSTRLNSSHV